MGHQLRIHLAETRRTHPNPRRRTPHHHQPHRRPSSRTHRRRTGRLMNVTADSGAVMAGDAVSQATHQGKRPGGTQIPNQGKGPAMSTITDNAVESLAAAIIHEIQDHGPGAIDHLYNQLLTRAYPTELVLLIHDINTHLRMQQKCECEPWEAALELGADLNPADRRDQAVITDWAEHAAGD